MNYYFAICTLGYVFAATMKISRDIMADSIDQPAYVRRPTLGKMLLALLLWWLPPQPFVLSALLLFFGTTMSNLLFIFLRFFVDSLNYRFSLLLAFFMLIVLLYPVVHRRS